MTQSHTLKLPNLPKLQRIRGESSLHLHARGSEAVVTMVIHSADRNAMPGDRRTPLQRALHALPRAGMQLLSGQDGRDAFRLLHGDNPKRAHACETQNHNIGCVA